MKKIFYFLIISLLISCSEDKNFDEIVDNSSQPELRTAGDGVYDVLGYGYDVTDEYMGETAVKRQVVNIKAFLDAGNLYKFDNPLVAVIKDQFYAGENAIAMSKEIITKSNFKGSIASNPTNTAEKETAVFSGGVGIDRSSNYSYSSKYSFARADILKKHRNLFVNASPAALSQYLHQQFTEDLKTLSADAIVIKYGTHVMTDITIGGFYKAAYKSAIIDETTSSSKTKTVESGLKVNLEGVGLSFNSSVSTTEAKSLNKKNTDWSCNIITVGGTTNGHSVTITPGSTTTHTFNVSEWAKSVDDKNSKLVELNWKATYPIYEFITDVTKKNQIIAAVEKYIKSKQLSILELKPLYRLRNDQGHFFHTMGPWMKVGEKAAEWSNEGVMCYVFDKPQTGYTLSSIYHIKNKQGLNYLSQSNETGSQGLYCYTLTNQLPGTLPLHKIYHSRDVNHYYTIDNYQKDQVLYVWAGWTYQNPIGYVYPGSIK